MKIHIDRDKCQLHGLCVQAAPKVFDFSDDYEDIVVLIDEVDPEGHLADSARLAVRSCPVAALRVE